MSDWLDQVNWNNDGLCPVITQEHSSKQVLTLAWMNRESLKLTAETGHAVYWSRSRQQLWHKGGQSDISRSSNPFVSTVIRMPFCYWWNKKAESPAIPVDITAFFKNYRMGSGKQLNRYSKIRMRYIHERYPAKTV
ncbi:phosphoribosyl-AMP cyclohydrolase [Methylophaga lonarensis MPL]|uniref:phosphoribosyl-AMP cyclohydrolase n=1 Tax=Methylophaga lonarensis MPL TaxID=1286106 RepID=M7PN95_9GAMM|nr:phosphoribosyl-AMP cyclohydrolase [Methylophaga lonarensis MPL]